METSLKNGGSNIYSYYKTFYESKTCINKHIIDYSRTFALDIASGKLNSPQ